VWLDFTVRLTVLCAPAQRVRSHLLMLHRSSRAFPRQLQEWDQAMLVALQALVLKLSHITDTVFMDAVAQIKSLNM
jgi:hypothetical protein